MKRIVIDGITYTAETETQAEEIKLLSEITYALWSEAFYDPYNESTQKFAEPLAFKMRRLNEIIGFKK